MGGPSDRETAGADRAADSEGKRFEAGDVAWVVGGAAEIGWKFSANGNFYEVSGYVVGSLGATCEIAPSDRSFLRKRRLYSRRWCPEKNRTLEDPGSFCGEKDQSASLHGCCGGGLEPAGGGSVDQSRYALGADEAGTADWSD